MGPERLGTLTSASKRAQAVAACSSRPPLARVPGRRRSPWSGSSARRPHTLKRKCMQSPSWTTYSLPSMRSRPFSRTAASLPRRIESSQSKTSALMKPRSKSVWMTPGGLGRLRALVEGPGAALLLAHGEVGLQARAAGSRRAPPCAGRARTGPTRCEEAGALLRAGAAGSPPRCAAASTTTSAPSPSRHLPHRGHVRVGVLLAELPLGDVGHVEHRLVRQQEQLADAACARPRRELLRAHGDRRRPAQPSPCPAARARPSPRRPPCRPPWRSAGRARGASPPSRGP